MYRNQNKKHRKIPETTEKSYLFNFQEHINYNRIEQDKRNRILIVAHIDTGHVPIPVTY